MGPSLPIVPSWVCCRLRLLWTRHLHPTPIDIYHTTRSIIAWILPCSSLTLSTAHTWTSMTPLSSLHKEGSRGWKVKLKGHPAYKWGKAGSGEGPPYTPQGYTPPPSTSGSTTGASRGVDAHQSQHVNSTAPEQGCTLGGRLDIPLLSDAVLWTTARGTTAASHTSSPQRRAETSLKWCILDMNIMKTRKHTDSPHMHLNDTLCMCVHEHMHASTPVHPCICMFPYMCSRVQACLLCTYIKACFCIFTCELTTSVPTCLHTRMCAHLPLLTLRPMVLTSRANTCSWPAGPFPTLSSHGTCPLPPERPAAGSSVLNLCLFYGEFNE